MESSVRLSSRVLSVISADCLRAATQRRGQRDGHASLATFDRCEWEPINWIGHRYLTWETVMPGGVLRQTRILLNVLLRFSSEALKYGMVCIGGIAADETFQP